MRGVALFLFVLGLATSNAQAAKKAVAPDWLREMATREVPEYDYATPSAAVLFREVHRTITPEGEVVTRERKAIKILTRRGAPEAQGYVYYRQGFGKVKRLEGWTIPKDGAVVGYGDKEATDVAAGGASNLYDESRIRMISAKADVSPGDVFGFESESVDRSIFTQFSYRFQDDLPTLTSQFKLTVPAGATAESVTFHWDEEVEPVLQGSTYSWLLQNLPPVVDEIASPSWTSLVPRVAVSYFPPPEAAEVLGPSFSEWGEVAIWLSSLEDPQSYGDDAVDAKAVELTASEAELFNKLAAIGRYAQDVKYVSIQTGVGRGGGYQPNPAAEIFAKNYGDCKDKANLMRAMFRKIGVVSHPVSVFAGDPNYVREEWPSPQQFNHAIIAIELEESLGAKAEVVSERYGRLLIFDPTDSTTPFGELRTVLAGSLALVADAEGGELLRLPEGKPEDHLVSRSVEAELAPDGTLSARVIEKSVGTSAGRERQMHEDRDPAAYRRMIERWVSSDAAGASVGEIAAADSGGGFELAIDFEAPRYARAMGSKLLVFRPAVLSRRSFIFPADDERLYPVKMSPRAFNEAVTVDLPEGFGVDETPEKLELETNFGRYSADWREQDGHLIFERKLLVKPSLTPAEEYDSVREFFEQIRDAEQAPVVLMRQ